MMGGYQATAAPTRAARACLLGLGGAAATLRNAPREARRLVPPPPLTPLTQLISAIHLSRKLTIKSVKEEQPH